LILFILEEGKKRREDGGCDVVFLEIVEEGIL